MSWRFQRHLLHHRIFQDLRQQRWALGTNRPHPLRAVRRIALRLLFVDDMGLCKDVPLLQTAEEIQCHTSTLEQGAQAWLLHVDDANVNANESDDEAPSSMFQKVATRQVLGADDLSLLRDRSHYLDAHGDDGGDGVGGCALGQILSPGSPLSHDVSPLHCTYRPSHLIFVLDGDRYALCWQSCAIAFASRLFRPLLRTHCLKRAGPEYRR